MTKLELVALGLAILLIPMGLAGEQDQSQIPDAPSATRPAQFPPGTAPAPKNPAPAAAETPTDEASAPAPPPPAAIPPKTTSTGQPGDSNSREDFTIRVPVNLVVVPVTVKDPSGQLVQGLLKKDFTVLEDGVEQRVTLFTSDPFPLSVAVVVDASLPANSMKKINETLPALAGAFSEFDEVSVYTYGSSVEKRLDFQAANENFSRELKRIKPKGREGAVLVNTGPLAAGPTVNNRPLDPSRPSTTVTVPPREYYVLNDAILAAAADLSRRDRGRRKMIFVISDGREQGSTASYDDVLKVLLSNEISVYAIGVDAAAIPGYDKIAQVRLPRMGYGNILPKYVSATGGEVFAEFTRPAIESAYSRLAVQARNQYTIGYNTSNVLASNYREIEVLVRRPGLMVSAKGGYYPLPPSRRQ
jgi:VWFA-related protein